MKASFFDDLSGKEFDKLYINMTEDGTDVYLSFATGELVKIICGPKVIVVYKESKNVDPVELKSHF